jgi:hypothetical protein
LLQTSTSAFCPDQKSPYRCIASVFSTILKNESCDASLGILNNINKYKDAYEKLLVFAMVMGMVSSLIAMEVGEPEVVVAKIVEIQMSDFALMPDGKIAISKAFLEGLKESLAQINDVEQLRTSAAECIQNGLVNTANYFVGLGFQSGSQQAKAQATFRDVFSNYSVYSKGGMGLAAVVFTGFALTGVYTAGSAFNQWRKNRNQN